MMRETLPFTRDLVLVGGGHAHALVLKNWSMNPMPGVRVTLISPQAVTPYTGMLPGLIAGHYTRDELEIDLVRLCRSAGARLALASVTGLDLERRRVILDCQAPVSFDIVSVNVGVSSSIDSLPGFARHAVPAKPLDRFADEWNRFLAAVASSDQPPVAAIIGAGVGGMELALAVAHRLAAETAGEPRITVLEQAVRPLKELGAPARNHVLNAAAEMGIKLLCGVDIERIEHGSATLADGRRVEAGLIIGAAAASPPSWFARTGIELVDGCIKVDEFLRSTSHRNVFAAGDCAHMSRHPRARAGVFAVRSARALTANLRAALAGRQPQPFRPQRRFLKLVSLGKKHAVGEKWGIAAGGAWVWRAKDRIDRRFMAKFENLTVMGGQHVPTDAAEGLRELVDNEGPLCGGCGSKVGRTALRSGLHGMHDRNSGRAAAGIGDDAAVLRWGGGEQVISTDMLRAFVDDPWQFARIAALHAMGDIWAMGAQPQAALATIVMPRMTERMLAETQREIMDSAVAVFAAEGAAIVGGHTSQGSDLLVGFTVTGAAWRRPVTKAGARPGDQLILTRPIGSGTVFAGDMAGKARGRDVENALRTLSRTSGPAAKVLSEYATAMTDVTGFGLAGHLFEILEASDAAAEVRLNSIPVLPGAAELARQGVRSSLWNSNAQLLVSMDAAVGTVTDLLFDPQTAGGLLATVAPNEAGEAVRCLREANESPAVIGEISEGSPWIFTS